MLVLKGKNFVGNGVPFHINNGIKVRVYCKVVGHLLKNETPQLDFWVEFKSEEKNYDWVDDVEYLKLWVVKEK